MSARAKVVIFGVASGLSWSLVPGLFGELFTSTACIIVVLLAGVATGILLSVALYRPLMRFNRLVALLLGLVSLPVGSFCFGVIVSVLGLILSYTTGEQRFVAGGFHPFLAGAQYAVFGVISILGIFLIPGAMLTTFLLRSALLGGPGGQAEVT